MVTDTVIVDDDAYTTTYRKQYKWVQLRTA